MKELIQAALVVYLMVAASTVILFGTVAADDDFCKNPKYTRISIILLPAAKLGCWLGEPIK
jgi:hypothetical protein